MGLLAVQHSLYSPYRPQSNGQTKQAKQILEQYLCCYINCHQDDWVCLSPPAEFAYNSSVCSSKQQTPLFVQYGFQTHDHRATLGWLLRGFPLRTPFSSCSIDFFFSSGAAGKSIGCLQRLCREAPATSSGLCSWGLCLVVQPTRCLVDPSSRLDHCYLGPRKIVDQVRPVAFLLQLPYVLRSHHLLHTSLLKPVHPNPFQQQP